MSKKTPWEQCPEIWSTEAKFWNYIRGVLRKGWSRFPLKLEYIKANRKRIPNPVEKNRNRFPEVWAMTCDICGVDHLQSNIEIDHKGDGSSFTGLHDVEKYVAHLFLVDYTSLRALCTQCHKIENQRQKKGISFEEATIDKEVIYIIATEKVEDIIDFIESYNYNGEYKTNNAANRRKALYDILKGVTNES